MDGWIGLRRCVKKVGWLGGWLVECGVGFMGWLRILKKELIDIFRWGGGFGWGGGGIEVVQVLVVDTYRRPSYSD